MIVGSLLLIVVAVGLLVLGLLQGSDAMLVASIGASLLAAVALIVGGRQAAAARSARTMRTGRQVPSERYDPMESRIAPDPSDDLDFADLRRARGGERQPVGAGARMGGTFGGAAVEPPADPHAHSRMDETAMTAPVRDEPEAPAGIPQQGDTDRGGYDAAGYDDDDDDYDDEDPADEPPVQASSAADVARVATLQTDVFVIDGRPRYHVQGCPHLLGREHEPLPAHEAVELGFTPCSVCAPNDVLLGRR
ncbi:hypothetical protein KZZ52_50520 [Dactylosporangium sp. AC04546]|uniref:hypothetical protein n=1 Tax=Dactylosporangium sp. AC04546 TaxID=2862460 RepID=UPI001EE14A82|nr:hypothetical protein [Dactylosporangium sp. AC04546]WVK82109.1 hypothetical protein KZZ52_50520 [Dactylosporangium sp. AC04546]